MDERDTILKIGNWHVGMSPFILDCQGALIQDKQEAYRSNIVPNMPLCLEYDASGHCKESIVIEDSWRKCYEEEWEGSVLTFYETVPNIYLMVEREFYSSEVQYALELTNKFSCAKLLYDATRSNGQLVFERLITPFSYAVMEQGGFVLHGVLMKYRDYGIIITAPSGTGKSTHAHLWREYENALIINGDRVLLQQKGHEIIGYGMPWCGSSGEYVNHHVPVAAIVVLSQGKENKVSSMDTVEAYMALLNELGAPKWEPDLYEKGIGFIDEMLSHLPVLKLSCRPDKEAMDVLKEQVDQIIKKKDCLLK